MKKKMSRHDCGNPNCIEFRKQMLFDNMFLVFNEAHEMIATEKVSDPVEALERGMKILRDVTLHGEVRQAQLEKHSQKFSH